MLKKSGFQGIIAPVVTPFTKEETLDEKTFRREVRYLLNAGVHGIGTGGSSGEGELLCNEELVRLIEIVQEENTKKIPVIAGVIRPSTREALRTGLALKKAGATALMVMPTHYQGGTDADGNYEYFDRISDAVGLPIIIYNAAPQNEVKADDFYKLLDIANVVGIKQSHGGMMGFLEMIYTCGEKGLIFSAVDSMLFSTFELGAAGSFAAISTLFPADAVEIWDIVRTGAGDFTRAKALQAKLYSVWSMVGGPGFPRRMKEVLNQIGRPVGIAASPRSVASAAEQESIRRVLSKFKG